MPINFNFPLSKLTKALSNVDKLNFWKERIEEYKEQEGLLYKNKQDADTLFGAIQRKIDLTDLYTYCINQTQKSFWNESIQELVKKEKNLFTGEIFNQAYEVEDIRNADAGFSFQNLTNFVRPWNNLLKQNYKTCRTDENNSVILNKTQLQFTQKENTSNAIRLIMPKNTRRVEIEDLNRNFWVIGDVISGVCEFLFSNNGLKGILQDIIPEIGELWENIFYLWVAAGLVAAEKQKTLGVHCEVLYVPNTPFQPYKKYDNFDNWVLNQNYPDFIDEPSENQTNLKKIKSGIDFLKKKYPKHDLCILPCIRYQNYEHNYYYYECYPFLYFYDRIKQEEIYKPLYSFYAHKDLKSNKIISYSQPLTFGVDLGLPSAQITAIARCAAGTTFGTYLYGIKKDQTKYYYPYSKIKIKYDSKGKPTSEGMLFEKTDNNYKYEALLEIKPKLSCKQKDDQLEATLSFDFFDAGERLISNTKTLIGNTEPLNNIIVNNNERIGFNTTILKERESSDFINFPVKDNCYRGELVTNYDYSSYFKGGTIQYDTEGLDISNQGILLKIGGYFPKTQNISALVNQSVEMQAEITDEWKNNMVREVLDNSGKRVGYKCNLTIGNNGTNWDNIAQYFNGHTVGNALNPVSDMENSVFMAEGLNKINNKWQLAFTKICQDASKVNFSGDNENSNSCGIKGLSAKMSQNYLQYAFEQTTTNEDFLDYHKVHYIITSIGITSWLGGAAKGSGTQQGYQGYWEQNVLCHYIRYIPLEYLNNHIPEISYESSTKSYPIIINSKIVGYIDAVAPINRAEGFVGDFLTNILKPYPGGSDRWRLPQLNASDKTLNTIYRVDPRTSAKFLYYYDKNSNKIKKIELDKESSGNEWFVTSDKLNLPDNPTEQQIQEAIEEYDENGGTHYTAYDILNKEYKISGIWNLFDGYTTNTAGNKESFIGGKHTQVLQVFFNYDNNNQKFVVSTEQGQSQYRKYSDTNWTDYTASDGSLGEALPYKGFIFQQSRLAII